MSGRTLTSTEQVASVENHWNVLKGALLEATDRSCGWTKGPDRHKETWWWNDDVSNFVSEKRKLWKEWKQGTTSKGKSLEGCLPGQM